MSRYLLVDAKILPDFFEKVLDVRLKLKDFPESSISQLCTEAGISRSTYYKYKDYIFDSALESNDRKAEIQLILNHKQGVLKDVLDMIAQCGGNILTIHQSAPISGLATLSLQMDISNINCDIADLIKRLTSIRNVRKAKMLSIE